MGLKPLTRRSGELIRSLFDVWFDSNRSSIQPMPCRRMGSDEETGGRHMRIKLLAWRIAAYRHILAYTYA